MIQPARGLRRMRTQNLAPFKKRRGAAHNSEREVLMKLLAKEPPPRTGILKPR